MGDRYQFVSKVGIKPVEVAPLEGAALRLEVISIVIQSKGDSKAFFESTKAGPEHWCRAVILSGGAAELTKVAGPTLSAHLFTLSQVTLEAG